MGRVEGEFIQVFDIMAHNFGHLFGGGCLLECELKMWQYEYQSPVHDSSMELQTIMELK